MNVESGKTKTGKHWIRFYLGHRRKRLSGYNLNDLKSRMIEMKRSYDLKGIGVELDKDKTFGWACDNFLKNHSKDIRDENRINQYFTYVISRTTLLRNIDKPILEKLRAVMKAGLPGKYKKCKGMSDASFNRRWKTLKAIFKHAGMKSNNPADLIEMYKGADKERTTYCTDEQFNALCKSATRKDDYEMLMGLRHTGMRPCEAIKAMCEHIDWNIKSIWVDTAKGGNKRWVPINSQLEPVLREIYDRQGGKGALFNMKGYNMRFIRLIEKAELEGKGLCPYSLRHSWGTYIQANCKDIKITQMLLGHKNINMTARYAHASEELARQAVEKVIVKI